MVGVRGSRDILASFPPKDSAGTDACARFTAHHTIVTMSEGIPAANGEREASPVWTGVRWHKLPQRRTRRGLWGGARHPTAIDNQTPKHNRPGALNAAHRDVPSHRTADTMGGSTRIAGGRRRRPGGLPKPVPGRLLRRVVKRGLQLVLPGTLHTHTHANSHRVDTGDAPRGAGHGGNARERKRA